MEESFEGLKDALTATPILVYPDFKSSEPFILPPTGVWKITLLELV
jgi:hypothetical protein